MRRNSVETIKTIVIVLLSISAVLLTLTANLSVDLHTLPGMEALAARFGRTAPLGDTPAAEPESVAAAKPLAISIRNETGRWTAARDFTLLDTAYEALAGYLGEALGTAETPEALSSGTLRTAMAAQSIYFSYDGMIPLRALANWLGTDYPGPEFSANWLMLLLQSDYVQLYFGDGQSQYYCQTQIPSDAIRTQIADYQPDGSYFAGESNLDAIRQLDAWSLLTPDASLPVCNAEIAMTDALRTATASALAFNPYGDGVYTAADGTVVYAESSCTLQLTPSGTLQLTNADANRYQLSGQDVHTQIAYALSLLNSLTATTLGDARLYLTDVHRTDTQTAWTFEYYIGGLPVRQTSGNGATVVFTGNHLSSLTLAVRRYTLTEQTTQLLPVPQAAAIAPAGANLHPEYADTGAAVLQAGWIGGN